MNPLNILNFIVNRRKNRNRLLLMRPLRHVLILLMLQIVLRVLTFVIRVNFLVVNRHHRRVTRLSRNLLLRETNGRHRIDLISFSTLLSLGHLVRQIPLLLNRRKHIGKWIVSLLTRRTILVITLLVSLNPSRLIFVTVFKQSNWKLIRILFLLFVATTRIILMIRNRWNPLAIWLFLMVKLREIPLKVVLLFCRNRHRNWVYKLLLLRTILIVVGRMVLLVLLVVLISPKRFLMLLLMMVRNAMLNESCGEILVINIMKKRNRPKRKSRAFPYNTLRVRYGLLLLIRVKGRFLVGQLLIPLVVRPLAGRYMQFLVVVFCRKVLSRKSLLVALTHLRAWRPLALLNVLIIVLLLIAFRSKYR